MLDRVDADAVRELVAVAAMDGTSPLLSLEVRHLEGALGRPDPNGGALSHLEAPYVVYAVGAVTSQEAVASIDDRVDAIRSSLAPWLSGSAYFHFAERGVDKRALYPAGVYERLARVRADVDPEGLFRARHTID
jgi:hypothetical protein